ncbi:hypothetical protein KEF29_22260 [Streptomyces tuirus]|uniref:SH3b domain-containing protein n=1 Tax=Streptomyces tuirus TaxID=68278 RepID=A0A941FB67_9ACTN|nr:hypothetical protein [Streptomyces tuirus]
MSYKKAFASIAATTAVLGGLTMTGAAPASAAATAYGCGSTGHNNSNAVHRVVVGHLRNGPASSCPQTQSVRQGVKFHAWCGVYNKHGNFWVYGRVDGGQTKGWIFSENLTLDSGSVKIC